MADLVEDGDDFPDATERVRALLEAAYAPNTMRAYRSDIRSFLEWGGSIPTTPDQIARYISDRSLTHSMATLKRHLSALSNLHSSLEFSPNPFHSPLIAKMLRGATRTHGTPQRAVEPLLIEDLRMILDQLGGQAVDIRDAALLTVGFAGAFRRSELVALEFDDVEEVSAGLKITIRRSKTDQQGIGRVVGIPFGKGRFCPVGYFRGWIDLVETKNGPLFRSCARSC
jgi:site-specific recombinase XerD